MSPRRREGSYARIGTQYLPAAVLVVCLSMAIAVGRRALLPDVGGVLGDLVAGVVLAAIAISTIGVLIVRPFEHRMHERRSSSAAREQAFRFETERRDFERRVTAGLDLCDNERDLLATASHAMTEAAHGRPTELLLAGDRDEPFRRAVVTGSGTPGCGVPDPASCPATRRGALQRFPDSSEIDACPWLRDRPQGRVGAVCAPVSITGRALGVLHAVHEVEIAPRAVDLDQFSALADHVGARIGVLRLTAAAAPTPAVGAAHEELAPSDLVDRAAVGGAPADGPALERGAVPGAVTTGDA